VDTSSRIIVADDQVINIEVMKSLVRNMGIYHWCTFAINGQEAINYATNAIMKEIDQSYLMDSLSKPTIKPVRVMLLDL
jgi:CheY-like chemotaxis protein